MIFQGYNQNERAVLHNYLLALQCPFYLQRKRPFSSGPNLLHPDMNRYHTVEDRVLISSVYPYKSLLIQPTIDPIHPKSELNIRCVWQQSQTVSIFNFSPSSSKTSYNYTKQCHRFCSFSKECLSYLDALGSNHSQA